MTKYYGDTRSASLTHLIWSVFSSASLYGTPQPLLKFIHSHCLFSDSSSLTFSVRVKLLILLRLSDKPLSSFVHGYSLRLGFPGNRPSDADLQ